MKFPLTIALLLLAVALLIVSCREQPVPMASLGPQGSQGLPGPAGPRGEQGPPGIPGQDGLSFEPPTFVGSQACADCHQAIYDRFVLTGHNFKLNRVVDGQPPQYPFSQVPSPPEGYTWDDVSYVVGGYQWKARFVGHDGFILTGDSADFLPQYNLPNDVLGTRPHWGKYYSGEEKKYDCGTCHTTGYTARGNQNDMPGMAGTWALDGIQCENCHGAGSWHVNNPTTIMPAINRDAASCGQCHTRGGPETIPASGGFIRHHETYDELFSSKHSTLNCVTCHDPHKGVVQLRYANEQTTRTQCANCHFKEARYENNEMHTRLNVQCVDCHMPRVVKNAVGDAARFQGDLRSHLVAIDPYQIEQFTEDGRFSLPVLSLNFACKSCHNPDGNARPRTDEELQTNAINYHTPPQQTVFVPVAEDEADADVESEE
jgi:hypothetical protein